MSADSLRDQACEPDRIIAAGLQVLQICQDVLVEPAGQVRAGLRAGRGRNWRARARWPGKMTGEMAGREHAWHEFARLPEAR